MEVKGQYIAYLAKSSEEMASQIAATGELHVLEYQSYDTQIIGLQLLDKRSF